MGVYKYLQKSWKEFAGAAHRDRMVLWRREPVTQRIEHPTRLDRARSVGYRAKQGFMLVRQRVSRGSHRRHDWSGGRHSHNMGARLNLRKNYQMIAEERAGRVFKNCEVLNSYYVDEDGKHYWFEVVLVDRSHPGVLADHRISWIGEPQHVGRVFRGLTSAGRKVRGLRYKGMGAEKARPSRRSHSRRL
ncbi:50S ribosomal protein L15e [Candidatus Woesearchaeota archaeon]|nr:50S ribosomal protein L15e [Candidatus Woesearchaeota archaeon]